MLEKEILKSCKNRLDYWQMQKVCVWWDRLNSGKMQFEGRYVQFCKPGTSDLIAMIKSGIGHIDMCHILFIEVKKPGKYKWSDDQKSFAAKFTGLQNVHYLLVTNPEQIDKVIELITSYSQKQLELMDKHMGGMNL